MNIIGKAERNTNKHLCCVLSTVVGPGKDGKGTSFRALAEESFSFSLF